MSLRQRVALDLERLPDAELLRVADYIAFLKYRSRRRRIPVPDENTLARLYAEFAEEDRGLAEAGMDDYAHALAREDEL